LISPHGIQRARCSETDTFRETKISRGYADSEGDWIDDLPSPSALVEHGLERIMSYPTKNNVSSRDDEDFSGLEVELNDLADTFDADVELLSDEAEILHTSRANNHDISETWPLCSPGTEKLEAVFDVPDSLRMEQDGKTYERHSKRNYEPDLEHETQEPGLIKVSSTGKVRVTANESETAAATKRTVNATVCKRIRLGSPIWDRVPEVPGLSSLDMDRLDPQTLIDYGDFIEII
jgi:hypothetical protein